MIAWLKGTLFNKATDRVVVEVGGVGYEVLIPFSTYYDLGEPGSCVSLHIHTHVREDALTLYGFLTTLEKRLFTLLIQVSGVGPRLAIAALSGLPGEELIRAITGADVARLSSIPGIGKKTAERMVLELKDKLKTVMAETGGEIAATSSGSAVQGDVISALVNLGYARPVAEKAVSSVIKELPEASFEDLLRRSLRRISG
ncbi:MAG TPA: Holliday junction branch migration protein RuvA [Acidobacteriota bacterium]|nr:Holliday junction branch migration protein RuvA [Acidobacteriota bacterium]